MTLLAKSAVGKGGPDAIFQYSDMAEKRAAEVGKENIVNATLGAILDAEGKLVTLKAVEESMKSQEFCELANYAPLKGSPEFMQAVIDVAFGDYKPNSKFAAIATPGGTGAVHNTFYNYLNPGEICLTTDYCWGNYKTILREQDCTLQTFNTFDEQDRFDMTACFAAVDEVAKKQENLMLVLNTPAHNPTGFAVSDEEWDQILEKLTAVANNGNNNVILLVDIAYIDFAGPQGRSFMKKFENLPKNFLVILAFSMSKGYTLYGYRLGAMIAISSSQEVIDEFNKANAASARGTWSNCNQAAMAVMVDLAQNPEKNAAFRAEQAAFIQSLANRAKIFTKEAAEVDLRILPYQAGFFIMVPAQDHEQAKAVAAVLREEDIFIVPLGKGLRVAICAIPEEKITGMAAKIKKAFQKIEQ